MLGPAARAGQSACDGRAGPAVPVTACSAGGEVVLGDEPWLHCGQGGCARAGAPQSHSFTPEGAGARCAGVKLESGGVEGPPRLTRSAAYTPRGRRGDDHQWWVVAGSIRAGARRELGSLQARAPAPAGA